ncbi:MAG TPA: DUF4363 family protein [Candidatus Atribacteria bacterium]|nr:DUF4363 family protein [Candidatus Atribacteria bacterium]HPT77641.1 DUF4363 family protein [Candidatus Atribacteria bacterium]
MRTILAIVLSLILFIAVGSYVQHYIEKTARNIAEETDRLKQLVEAGSWDEAGAVLNRITEEWTVMRRKWNALIDHSEVDRIDDALARTGELINLKEIKDCLVEIAVLKQTILHIPENERLALSNIF